MKNLLLFCLLSTVFLTSCGKELEDEVIGTWIVFDAKIDGCDDVINNEIFANFSDEPCIVGQVDEPCRYSEIVFTESNYTYNNISTESFGSFEESGAGEYSITEDQLLTTCEDGECDTATISIENDAMLLHREVEDQGEGCREIIILMRK